MAQATMASDYSCLSRRIRQAGLLDRRPLYYFARLSTVAGLFAAGLIAFFALGDSWLQIPLAAYFAIVFAQVALVAHDLAHRQIFVMKGPSDVLGRLAGNLGIGLGYGWWMNKHTRHHANPNHEDLDPDVVPDVLVWSQEQARNSKGLARFIGRRQAFLFYPLLLLEGLNLHVSGVRALRQPWMKHRVLEGTLLFAHFGLYLAALALTLSPGKALVFFAVHQGLFGVYMGCVFAPGHKGMPTLTGEADLDFLRKQVLTTRNVRGGWFVDIAMGGLNYQIEHHLFPNMPTPSLREARPIVRAYCRQLGLPYCETGFVSSHVEAIRHLHDAGAPIRREATS
ncbi:fatty acid desaturase family protein [Nonomuraea sediminis]|uniref:fatty acid desaturase family protein n=1 Tax=Nonomuraea sediminis TaxID=2835864 RepID=UPI001BDC090E|nr:acyl-CoA desaturase [Nonomuraea sediminis]